MGVVRRTMLRAVPSCQAHADRKRIVLSISVTYVAWNRRRRWRSRSPFVEGRNCRVGSVLEARPRVRGAKLQCSYI